VILRGLAHHAVKDSMDANNQLLDALSLSDRCEVLRACESVALVFGDQLYRTGQTGTHVFFPSEGFVSLIAQERKTPAVEIGMVGTEGMLGTHHTLGVDAAQMQATVQGAGSAWRMTAVHYRDHLRRHESMDALLRRYACVLLSQFASEVPCMRYHSITQRLARWLLMSQDRAASDQFRCTHEFLASMLGVRRAGVTVAAGVLQEAGLITYARGAMNVLDRPGLEKASCECYRNQRDTYKRIMRARRAVRALDPQPPTSSKAELS
jgi:CRP-like cAMP-binding protein